MGESLTENERLSQARRRPASAPVFSAPAPARAEAADVSCKRQWQTSAPDLGIRLLETLNVFTGTGDETMPPSASSPSVKETRHEQKMLQKKQTLQRVSKKQVKPAVRLTSGG
jgi:hypothetical protein